MNGAVLDGIDWPNDGEWHHIAIQVAPDGSRTVYVDGLLVPEPR